MSHKVKQSVDLYAMNGDVTLSDVIIAHTNYFGETKPRKTDYDGRRGLGIKRSWLETDLASLPDRLLQFCTNFSNSKTGISARVRVVFSSTDKSVLKAFAPTNLDIVNAPGAKLHVIFVDWQNRTSYYFAKTVILDPGTLPNGVVDKVSVPSKLNTAAINTLANITGTPKSELKTTDEVVTCLSALMPANLTSQILLKGQKLEFVSSETGKLFSFLVGLGLKPEYNLIDPSIKNIGITTSGVLEVVMH